MPFLEGVYRFVDLDIASLRIPLKLLSMSLFKTLPASVHANFIGYATELRAIGNEVFCHNWGILT